MGDRITTYYDCPDCGGKETFECYEAISSLLKVDRCDDCGYTVSYPIDDDGTTITIGKGVPNRKLDSEDSK